MEREIKSKDEERLRDKKGQMNGIIQAGSDKNFCCLQTKFSYPCLPTKACIDIIFTTLPVLMFKICIKCSFSA